MIHPSAIIDDGAKIGRDCRIWHFVHVCSGAVIGRKSSLGQGVFVGGTCSYWTELRKIQNNVSIYDGVTIENDVFVDQVPCSPMSIIHAHRLSEIGISSNVCQDKVPPSALMPRSFAA